MIEFIDVSTLNLEALYQQLGMADYTLIQTTDFLDQLNEYRAQLMNRIGAIQHGRNDKSVGDSAELRTDNRG